MRYSLNFILGILLISFLATTAQAQWLTSPDEDCEQPGRDRVVCYLMKHMRAQLNLFEAQRDLMQVNFPLLRAVSHDLDRTVNNLLVQTNYNVHFKEAGDIRIMAQEAEVQADKKDINVFKTMNALRGKCLACHRPEAPTSGYSWKEISKLGWDAILVRCNTPGRNPYICRNMFGLFTSLNYMATAETASNRNFAATALAAQEMARIAHEVREKGGVHPKAAKLEFVEAEAKAILSLALAQNSEAFYRVDNLQKTCQACHTKPAGDGTSYRSDTGGRPFALNQ